MTENQILPAGGSKKPRFFYGYIVVMAAFLIMLIMHGAIYSYGVFFKPMSMEFGWTREMTSGAFSMCLFVVGFLNMVTGRLGDRFGPRIVVTVCGFLFGLGYLLMSQINTIWQLYLVYGAIIAMGVSGCFVPLTSTVTKWFAKRRGGMTGVVVAGIGVGIVVMPPMASRLISSYGWRTPYIIIGLIALVVLMLVAQSLKRDPSQIGQLPYGENEVNQQGSVSGGRGFSLLEAIRTKQFWMLSTIYLCFGISLQSIMVHIVPHVTDQGISAIIAANILTVIGALSLIGRVTMGVVADRIGNKPCLIVGLIVLSVSLSWLLVAKELWMLYLFAAIFGFGYGSLVVLISLVVAELFGLSSHGVILGAVLFIMSIGEAIGPVFAGRIFDVAHSYSLAFEVSSVLSVISIILASLLKPPHKKAGRSITKQWWEGA